MTKEQIEAHIFDMLDDYKKSFDIAFQSAMKAYEQQMLEQEKPMLKHVYISFLRSSIANHLPLLQVDCYDETDIEDWSGSAADWDVPFSKELYLSFPLLEGYEAEKQIHLEMLQAASAELFFTVLKSFLPQITKNSMQKISPEVLWHYGEYLDQSAVY